jgi:hypothetical protein
MPRTVVAGTGTGASASNQLNSSHGIFSDKNFDLYVADYSNECVQQFQFRKLDRITLFFDSFRSFSSVLMDIYLYIKKKVCLFVRYAFSSCNS